MAWFLNHYKCEECTGDWADEWSCMCDDECPHCGARDMTPYHSDDLSKIIAPRSGAFVVLWSPETAEHSPDYSEVAILPSREQAEAYVPKE